jgi:serine/threonine-protein kinase HipA
VNALPVYYEARTVGSIEVGTDGPTFLYDPEWLRTRGAFPLSILMPLSTRPVKPALFLPWAANLLPEGAQLRTVGRALGASPDDVIGILSEIGRDTAGALSVGRPGSTSPGDWKPVRKTAELERIIDELPKKPFLAGEEGVSMSLAGVQNKLGVAIDARNRICIPTDGAPSTHILKPDSERLLGGVQNEALCLTLARRCGLNVPDLTTGTAGRRTYLLINRYDRIQQGDRWRRLHQEDFCQALGRPPSAKYESNQTGIKGPTLAEMFALTRNAMGAPDVLALLDQVIFNIIACNTDAHAKNYSLMISGRGFALAPLYDVMCAAAWEGITRNLAQKIAGKNRGEHLKRRHWERFAEECGLNPTQTVRRVEALATAAIKELTAATDAVNAMPAGPHVMVKHFADAIARRARALISGLNEKSVPPPASPARPKLTKPKRAASKTKAKVQTQKA